MCDRKSFRHQTVRSAEAHLERLKNLPDATDTERLHIYWCPYPSQFHAIGCKCEEPKIVAEVWCEACGGSTKYRHMHVGHRRKIEQQRLEQEGEL